MRFTDKSLPIVAIFFFILSMYLAFHVFEVKFAETIFNDEFKTKLEESKDRWGKYKIKKYDHIRFYIEDYKLKKEGSGILMIEEVSKDEALSYIAKKVLFKNFIKVYLIICFVSSIAGTIFILILEYLLSICKKTHQSS